MLPSSTTYSHIAPSRKEQVLLKSSLSTLNGNICLHQLTPHFFEYKNPSWKSPNPGWASCGSMRVKRIPWHQNESSELTHRTYSCGFQKSKREIQTPYSPTRHGTLKNRCIGLGEKAFPDLISKPVRGRAVESGVRLEMQFLPLLDVWIWLCYRALLRF